MTDLRARSTAVDEQVVRPRRAVRVPFLAAAVGLVLAATVLVVWGFSKAADRTEVLMVTAEVEAGHADPGVGVVDDDGRCRRWGGSLLPGGHRSVRCGCGDRSGARRFVDTVAGDVRAGAARGLA